MKTIATKKPVLKKVVKPIPKTTALKKPINAPTKGTTAKNTTARKTNTVSKTSAASTSTLTQAKAIDVLCRQIETGQRQLAALLNRTVQSLEKSLQTTKITLTKLAEQEKKNKSTLKTCQAKHKTKPTASTIVALKKAEHVQQDIAIAREKAQIEQTNLLSQLRHYQSLVKGKPSQKNTALKPTIVPWTATQSLKAVKSAALKSPHTAKPPASPKKPAASTTPMIEEMSTAPGKEPIEMSTNEASTSSSVIQALALEEAPGSQCVS